MARGVHRSELVTVAALKAALSIAVTFGGFVAVSDDDYSRTVIAEQFARAPSLDPSKTSWLPLPFWIHGAVMAVFGRSIATAHGTALVLGVASALCMYLAAIRLGVSRPCATIAALVATGIPTAARLGVSTQPEALVAGLVVLAATTTLMDGRARLAGAFALGAACLCRYEPWAAAAVFAALALYDGARSPDPDAPRNLRVSGFTPRRDRLSASRRALRLAALVAIAPSLAWVVHGALAHGDALFFLHRVSAYRRALGISEPIAASVLAYPRALFSGEPELMLAAIVVLFIARKRAPEDLALLLRPALVVAAILVFLIVGRVLDGAPTHHAERTLLPVWSLLAIVVAEGAVRLLALTSEHPQSLAMRAAVPAGLVLAAASVAFRSISGTDPGAPRTDERQLGIAARALVAPEERLAVDTKDYGYFAVIAAFGAPERAAPLERHDPREPASSDPFESLDRLTARLRAENAGWLVVHREHLPVAAALGVPRANAGELSLVQLELP
jgi:hypothetical protein